MNQYVNPNSDDSLSKGNILLSRILEAGSPEKARDFYRKYHSAEVAHSNLRILLGHFGINNRTELQYWNRVEEVLSDYAGRMKELEPFLRNELYAGLVAKISKTKAEIKSLEGTALAEINRLQALERAKSETTPLSGIVYLRAA